MKSGGPVEVWRGGVPAWECDEMGHMNVRFYLARAMQGLAGAAAALGMPNAFGADAGASLLVRGHHVRFLREAQAGASLHMTAGVLSIDQTDAVLLQTLVHTHSGEAAATFVTRVSHVAAREGRPFAWPQRAREAAEALRVELPGDAGTRSVPEAGLPAASVTEAAGLATVARGAVGAEDCDVFGRIRTDLVLGWLVAGIPHLVEPLRREARALLGPQARVGGAALEYRLTYYGAPGAGDLVEARSGLTAVEPKLARMRHWLIDPRTGAAWASAENVSISFDLDSRKAIALPADAVKRLQAMVRPAPGPA